jgi:uncharacterized protein YebE (UPF0316 family)
MNLFWTFVLLNVVNVIIQTIKSLCTVKGNKIVAAVANAVAYGLYTVVVIYMVCELPTWQKVLVVGACNLVGVYLVKLFEEKLRKDKLWKIEVTIPKKEFEAVIAEAKNQDLSFNYVDINKYYLFNFYCPTQADSAEVKNLLSQHEAKYFVSESKTL